MIPKTAGKILEEEEIRAFLKCPQFYKRGGIFRPSFEVRVLKKTVEYTIIKALRSKLKDPLKDIHSLFLRCIIQENSMEGLLENQLKAFTVQGTLWLNKFFAILPLGLYFPVLGRITPVHIVSKTPVRLDISAVLRSTKNQTLHLLSFSPYYDVDNMEKDPINIWKLYSLQDFVGLHPRSGRPQTKLHLLTFNTQNNLKYTSLDSNDLTEKRIAFSKSVIKSMESGFSYPLLPCPYPRCSYRNICGF